ncbi:MAG: DUF4136 domain-containing protein [Bacteroidales bacterium]|jgi:hypothetical protein
MMKTLLPFKRISILVALFSGVLLLQSCYPDETLSPAQTDVVYTNYYDSAYNLFKGYSLYYMPDTVFNIDTTKGAQPIGNQSLILNDIVTNMESMGYTRISGEEPNITPDLVIVPSGIITDNVSVYYYYPYYGYGWGWDGWGGYGWGYPGYYPPVPYYTSYTTGTLRLEMFNPSDYRVIKNDTINPVYWTCGINGVLEGNDITSRITSTLDQAFKQSPYLKTNGH